MDGENMDRVSNLDEDDIGEMIEIDDIIGDDDDDMTEDINDLQLGEEEEYDDEENDYDYERQIIEPLRDDADVVFEGHKDEVYCIANYNGMIATGGKDDRCLVWSANNGQILFECKGHEDSVDSVTFNQNGTYLATGDLKGLIKVWDVRSGQQIWSFEISSVQWLKWHKINLLLSGSVDGDIWLWNIPYGHTKTFPSHGITCSCGNFFPDGKRICVGYEDGTVKIWDLKTTSCLFTFPPSKRYHESHVICIDCHQDNLIFATGSWDGSVLIYNSMSGQMLTKYSVLSKEDSTEDEDRIESLAFSTNASFPYLAIGCSSGRVIVWDLHATAARFQIHGHTADVVKVIWHPVKSNLLFSCSVDASVVAWDSRDGQKVASYLGHTRRIFGFDVKSDGGEMYTTSADSTARVFKVKL